MDHLFKYFTASFVLTSPWPGPLNIFRSPQARRDAAEEGRLPKLVLIQQLACVIKIRRPVMLVQTHCSRSSSSSCTQVMLGLFNAVSIPFGFCSHLKSY